MIWFIYIIISIIISCVTFKYLDCNSDAIEDVTACTLIGLVWPLTIIAFIILNFYKILFKLIERF